MAEQSLSIKVQGLAELNRAFKAVDDKVSGEGLKVAFLGIASTVASKAAMGVPRGATGDAAASYQPHSTSRGASVSMGGSAAPYAPFLDFGGTTGRGHKQGPMQGAIKRDYLGRPVGSGRYLYPAISSEKEATADAVEAAIAGIAKAEDFEVT